MNFFKSKKVCAILLLLITLVATLISFIFGCAQGGFAAGPPLYFLYVGDSAPGVYGFSINPSSGVLTPVPGSPFSAGTSPTGSATDPTGHFVFITDNVAGGTYAYTINPTTGALTEVSGSPFASSATPTSVVVDATGRFVYVADGGGASPGVYGYTINTSTGALSMMTGSPFGPGTLPIRINSDPSGRFVYASENGGIYAYTINSQTGSLTAVTGSPFLTVGSTCRGVAFDQTDSFLYVACWAGGSPGIYAFDIQSSGALTGITGSPFPNGSSPAQQIAVAGQYLYLSGNITSSNIYENTINPSTGALTTGSPYAPTTAGGSFGVAADPTGQFIYAVGSTTGVYGSVINQATGALTQIPGSPFSTGGSPFIITTVKVPQPRYP